MDFQCLRKNIVSHLKEDTGWITPGLMKKWLSKFREEYGSRDYREEAAHTVFHPTSFGTWKSPTLLNYLDGNSSSLRPNNSKQVKLKVLCERSLMSKLTKDEQKRLKDIEERLRALEKAGHDVRMWNDYFFLGVIRKIRGTK